VRFMLIYSFFKTTKNPKSCFVDNLFEPLPLASPRSGVASWLRRRGVVIILVIPPMVRSKS